MVRTPCWDKSGLKKGTWTPEEDRKLIAYVTTYGHWNWRLVPKFAGLARCGKSCRLRWLNYLRPNIKRGNFTPQEEDHIIKLHAKLGNRWSKIAAELPGRSDNEIKNHWHSNLKKRLPQKTVAHEIAEVLEPKDKCSVEPVASDSTALWSITGMTGAAGDSALVEEYTEPVTPDFWTELYCYVVDISYFPGELVAPTSLNEPEILSPVYDAQLWSHSL